MDSLVQGLGHVYQGRTDTGTRQQFWPDALLPLVTRMGTRGSWTEVCWAQVRMTTETVRHGSVVRTAPCTSPPNWWSSLQCVDTVGWTTRRASGW